jgi:hypothetical protein
MSRLFAPRIRAGQLIESFLISAVFCVFAIRFFLASTGYPQLGGGGLHIAHMLWGGLGMLAALLLVFASINSWSVNAAAVLGGLGFGAFIDEVGKFVTSDNNYFFRPAVAMIYVAFMLLYLLSQAVQRRIHPSPAAYLANALDLAKEAALRDLDADERQRARAYLQHADSGDPLTAAISAYLDTAGAAPGGRRRVGGLTARLHGLYHSLVARSWFATLLVLVFVIGSFVTLLESMITIPGVWEVVLTVLLLLGGFVGAVHIAARRRIGPVKRRALTAGSALAGIVASGIVWALDPSFTFPTISFSDWCQLLSTVAIGILVLTGVWSLRRSHLQAYRWFQRGVLVSIFFAQAFAFYRNQFWAIVGLAVSILIWGVLRYMIYEEETAEAAVPGTPEAAGSADETEHPTA